MLLTVLLRSSAERHLRSWRTTQELSHIRKQGEESVCLVAFKILFCSSIIILNKQTTWPLSISPLWLPAPQFSSPSPLTQHTVESCCYCSQGSVSPPRPKMPPYHFTTQTSIYTSLLCLPGMSLSKMVILHLLVLVTKAPKIAVEWQNSAKSSIFIIFVCRLVGH